MSDKFDAATFFMQPESLPDVFSKTLSDFKHIYPELLDEIVPFLEGLGFENVWNAPVFHGTDDFIFFGKHHGLTMRISRYEDEACRMHPAQTVPIALINLENDLTVRLYAGETLVQNYDGKEAYLANIRAEKSQPSDALAGILMSDYYNFYDLRIRNLGYVTTDQGDHLISIDTDCIYKMDEGTHSWRAQFNEMLAQEGRQAALQMQRYAALQTDHSAYQGLALRHQDLREAFFEAWPGAHLGQGAPDLDKMKAFWDLAKSKVEKPKRVARHDWIERVNENGIKVRVKIETGAVTEGLTPAWKKPKAKPT